MEENNGETLFGDIAITPGDIHTNFGRMKHFHGLENDADVAKLIPGFWVTAESERHYFKTEKGRYITAMFVYYLLNRFNETVLRRSGTVRQVIEELYPTDLVEGAKVHETTPDSSVPHFTLALLLMQGPVEIEAEPPT